MSQEKTEDVFWYDHIKELITRANTTTDSEERERCLSKYEEVVRRIDMTLMQCGSPLRVIDAPLPWYLEPQKATSI